MRSKLWPLLLIALLLAGFGGRQMEEELLVIVLAADRDGEGNYRLSVKAPAASQQQDEEKGYLTLEALGGSFAEAMLLLHASTPRRLNFSQVREVMINSGAAESDALHDLLREISALPRFRGAAAVIVCPNGACEAAARVKPYMGLRLSRYTEDSLTDASEKGFTPNATVLTALRDLGSGVADPLLILGDINRFSGEGMGAGLSALAGSLARKSADPIDLFGAAVTDGTQVTGYLTGEEMALLHLLTGSGHFYVENLDNRPVTLYARGPAELSVRLSERPIRLEIRLMCDARCAPKEAWNEEEVRAETEARILALIRRLQRLDCDALGFGSRAVRSFLWIRDWEKLDFKRLYREAEISVFLTVRPLSD